MYEKQIKSICYFADEVVKLIEFEFLSIQEFTLLYQVYFKFKSHKELCAIVRSKLWRSGITEFMLKIKEKIQKSKEADKLAGVGLIERFFILERDEELITEEMNLKMWISHLFESNKNNVTVLNALMRLFFEMMKRIG